ncbi:MAG: glutathione S-transferase family protein [bacterium]|nr:glutathione S-transferase family protein [bacterium]
MSDTITIIQYPGLSRNKTLSGPCGKVHMALALKGQPFEIHNVQTPGQAKKFNPRGRVPSVKFGNEIVVDSSDILTEIDRRFPDPPLDPDDSLQRTRAKMLEDWGDEVLYFYIVWVRWCQPDNFERMCSEVLSKLPVPVRWIIPSYARRAVVKRLSGQGVGLKGEACVRRELYECLDNVAELLRAGPFLVGDRISRADISVGSMLDQLSCELLTPQEAGEIRARPEIPAWLDRLHEVAPSAVR